MQTQPRTAPRADGHRVLYVVYQDMTGKSWRLQCVPVAKASFESKRPLPQAWRGVRDEELSKLTGIDSCVFRVTLRCATR